MRKKFKDLKLKNHKGKQKTKTDSSSMEVFESEIRRRQFEQI